MERGTGVEGTGWSGEGAGLLLARTSWLGAGLGGLEVGGVICPGFKSQ